MAEKEEKKERLIVPREQYLTAGAHIGMAFKSAGMRKFIYKIRSNGLAVLNIGMLDKRIGCAAEMIARAKNPMIVCRKEIGWDAVSKFGEVTGTRVKTSRFMPGSLTNPSYEDYFEPDLLIIVDPLVDRQAMKEAVSSRVPIIGLADTSHDTAYLDLVIPCNNKGKKSLALVFWAIASEIKKKKGEQFDLKMEDFGWE